MALPTDFRHRYGPLALVTGASSGIGEAFARALAAEGLDLLILARRRDRLDALAEALREAHDVDVQVLDVDLGRRDFLAELLPMLEGRDLGLVVSNAGAGAKGAHHEIPVEALEAVIDVNCRAPLLLVHALAPRLIERGRGGLLITGSIEGYTPTPNSAAYAASKAFVRWLGAGLWGELRGAGVDVLVLAPGATDTEMLPKSGMSKHDMPTPVMTAEEVAREGLEALRRGPSRIAGRVNRALVGLLSLLPGRIAVRAAGHGMREAIEKGRLRQP